MPDFDLNVNIIRGKTILRSGLDTDGVSNPGKILESKYISNSNNSNENSNILSQKNSRTSLYEANSLEQSKSNFQSLAKPSLYNKSFISNIVKGIYPFSKNISDTNPRAKKSKTPFLLYKHILTRFNEVNTIKILKYTVMLVSLILSIAVLSTLFFTKNINNIAEGQVAGISEKVIGESNQPTDAYKAWIGDKLGSFYPPNEDFDGDQLTNEEEFIVGTDPKNAHTCDSKKTDAENLVELINPISCKPIDLNDQVAVDKFNKIINLSTLNTKVVQNTIQNPINDKSSIDNDTIMGVFGATSLESLNKQEYSKNSLQSEIDKIKSKESLIDKIARINQYMKETRSLEPYDRNYPIPVNGAVYLEVSLKYKTPLKYVLAVAQRESRFGTDKFDKSGNLTRPGKYQNIFSMGLDDSGNNIGFETWEKGVESFGRWYKKFQDRGVSDCAKWRIYNPNGDYCKNVEETASQIDYYLNK